MIGLWRKMGRWGGDPTGSAANRKGDPKAALLQQPGGEKIHIS
jgi:hypothetical protein